MWLYGQGPIKVSYHPDKCDHHRYSDSGKKVVLVSKARKLIKQKQYIFDFIKIKSTLKEAF